PRGAAQQRQVRRIGVLVPYDEDDPLAKTFVSAFTRAGVPAQNPMGLDVESSNRTGSGRGSAGGGTMWKFFSWSGQASQQVASALRDWLKMLLPPSTDIWMSDEDISVGSRWEDELDQQLERSTACIVCLTPENMNSTWLHFEAGRIAKEVCPFLV